MKWVLGPNHFNLQIVGLWQSTSDHSSRKILSNIRFGVIVVVITLSSIIPSILALSKVWGNLTLMIENLQITLPVTASVIKLLALWSKREVLALMNDMVMADWLMAKTDKVQSVMEKWARPSRIISVAGNILMFTTLALFIILPWLGLSIRIATDVKGIDHRLAFQSYYFYNTSKASNFAFTYFAQITSLFMCGIAYTGVDGYLTLLVFHICAQLQNLRERLLNLNEFKDFRYAIALCVQEHVRLLRFIEMIDNSFTLMLLVLLIYFGILFCFYGFIVASQVREEAIPIGRMIFLVFSISLTFSHMCLFCIVGEILVIQTELIYYTIYDYEWYTIKPEDARCLICLMIRASKPCYITAGKLFPMTMSTFCSLLKTSGGYISVLLANQD